VLLVSSQSTAFASGASVDLWFRWCVNRFVRLRVIKPFTMPRLGRASDGLLCPCLYWGGLPLDSFVLASTGEGFRWTPLSDLGCQSVVYNLDRPLVLTYTCLSAELVHTEQADLKIDTQFLLEDSVFSTL